jgi:hypothetical protein
MCFYTRISVFDDILSTLRFLYKNISLRRYSFNLRLQKSLIFRKLKKNHPIYFIIFVDLGLLRRMSQSGAPSASNFAAGGTSVPPASSACCHAGNCAPYTMENGVTYCTICKGCQVCENMMEQYQHFLQGEDIAHSPVCDCRFDKCCNNPVKIREVAGRYYPSMYLCRGTVCFKGPLDEYTDGGVLAYTCCCSTCVTFALMAAGPCHEGKCTTARTETGQVYCTACTYNCDLGCDSPHDCKHCVWCKKNIRDQAKEADAAAAIAAAEPLAAAEAAYEAAVAAGASAEAAYGAAVASGAVPGSG